MPTLSKIFLLACVLMLAACSGNAARPDGGTGSGGAGSGTGGAQASGGAVGSGGAGPGTGGAQASGGTVGTGGAAQTGGRGGGQGGTTGGQGGGGRGGDVGQGGRGGQAGQAGNPCAAPVAQGVCTSEGITCSIGCTDACHFCNVFRCQGGRWMQQEAFPAPCFTCGPTLSCQKNAQYCHQTTGGPAGSMTTYQCRATPTACLPTPTCTCLQAQSSVSGTSCQQGAAGELTVMTALP